jgi:hypothetical protein
VAAFFWRLTSVALRAPSVSRQKGKSGTSYFAQIRNFLLCLDTLKKRLDCTAKACDCIINRNSSLEHEVFCRLEVSKVRRGLTLLLVALGLFCYSGVQSSGLGADVDHDGIPDSVYEESLYVTPLPAVPLNTLNTLNTRSFEPSCQPFLSTECRRLLRAARPILATPSGQGLLNLLCTFRR